MSTLTQDMCDAIMTTFRWRKNSNNEYEQEIDGTTHKIVWSSDTKMLKHNDNAEIRVDTEEQLEDYLENPNRDVVKDGEVKTEDLDEQMKLHRKRAVPLLYDSTKETFEWNSQVTKELAPKPVAVELFTNVHEKPICPIAGA